MTPPRSVQDVLASRLTITAAGAQAIGRRPVGTVRVPWLDLPWRDDARERRKDAA